MFESDDAGERAINEQAAYLSVAAERLRFALQQLSLECSTPAEEGVRMLKTWAEQGRVKRICLLDVGHHTAAGVTYVRYRALFADGSSIHDCTYAVAAALGFKTAEGGEISFRGFRSVSAEVGKRLEKVLPDLKVSAELVW